MKNLIGYSLFSIILCGLFCSTGCGSLVGALLTAEVQVGTHAMEFTGVVDGENPDPQETTASCVTIDDDLLEESCTAEITVDKDWLSVDPPDVTGTETIEISVDTEGLEAGVHVGTVHVEYILVSLDDEEDITITLTVTE